jgi:hypothetical protein
MDYSAAQDVLFGIAQTYTQANAVSLLGSLPTVFWQGTVSPDPVSGDAPQMRISMNNIASGETGLRNTALSLYTTTGLLNCLLSISANSPDAAIKLRAFATGLCNAYRKYSGDVYTYNEKVSEERGIVEGKISISVTAEYSYREQV